MRISDWSSDVCSSDLLARRRNQPNQPVDHSIHIPQNIRSPHPNHNKPLPRQPRIAVSVMLDPSIMRQPINPDDHPPLRRVKIRPKPPHRMLPPKLHPTRPPERKSAT